MNITDFENRIPYWLHERGRNYFLEDRIKNFKSEDNTFTARVIGRSAYDVKVILDSNGEIIQSMCTCPYDAPICKHQIAMYYKINDWIEDVELQCETISQDAPYGEQKNLTTLLNEKTKEELIKFVVEMANKDNDIYYELMLRLQNNSNAVSMARLIIDNCIFECCDYGYIKWNDVPKIAKTFDKVLNSLIDDEKSVIKNLKIYLMLLETLASLENFADDSGGYLAQLSYQVSDKARDLVLKVVKNGSNSVEDEIFEVFKEALNEAEQNKADQDEEFVDYEEILEFTIPLLKDENKRRFIEAILDERIHDDFKCYGLQNAILIKYKIIQAHDSEEKEDAFINENLDKRYFRKIAIEKAIQRKKYQVAIDLCKSKENEDEYFYNGKKYLLQIYKEIGDVENIRKYAEILFFTHVSLEYYDELKNTFTKSEWKKKVAQLIETVLLISDKHKSSYGYELILCNEHLNEEMIAYCEKNQGKIFTFYKDISKSYKDDIVRLLKRAIESNIQISKSKEEYLALKAPLYYLSDLCGKKKFNEYIDYLSIKFKTRRALKKVLMEISN